ncbi:50S ribosomal protein L25 [Bernardetia sp. Wsw4-3y2]|uniref:50S ribosomal protein L25 n=1 Tax=unclassified Bernardetia TaxID=2647129 RepID=UPI0030CDDC9B
MKSLEIIGYYRKENQMGAKAAHLLRLEGYVPCVLYGTGGDNKHFYVPNILFRDLIYTSKVHTVELNIEGDIYNAIVQDYQTHPVSDVMMHVDFLAMKEDKPVKIDVPVKLIGRSVGEQKGGRMVLKMRKLKVKALPANLPDTIEVNVAKLDLGKSIKLSEIGERPYEIMNSPLVSIATVTIPRTLRTGGGMDTSAEEETEEEA